MAVLVGTGSPSILVDQEYVYAKLDIDPLHSRVILSPACRVAGEVSPPASIDAVSWASSKVGTQKLL